MSVVAACGSSDVERSDASGVSNTSIGDAPASSNFVEANAALRRITMEEFTDVTIDIDYSSIGGFDLADAAPAADLTFCDAVGDSRIEWIDSSVIAVQFWHDAFAVARDVPPAVHTDLDLLLEHTAQRIAWNFRRADEPVTDDRIVEAAHAVISAAVETCPGLPPVTGRSDEQLRMPWAEDSYDDRDVAGACASDLAEVLAAIDRYMELRETKPRHLEQVHAALLGDESVLFFGSELHEIAHDPNATTDDDAAVIVVPVLVGPCVVE